MSQSARPRARSILIKDLSVLPLPVSRLLRAVTDTPACLASRLWSRSCRSRRFRICRPNSRSHSCEVITSITKVSFQPFEVLFNANHFICTYYIKACADLQDLNPRQIITGANAATSWGCSLTHPSPPAQNMILLVSGADTPGSSSFPEPGCHIFRSV